MPYSGTPSRTAVNANFDTAYTAPARAGGVDHNFVESGPQVRVSAPSMLGNCTAVGQLVVAAWSSTHSPLAEAILVYVADGTKEAYAAAASMLGAVEVAAEHAVATWAASPTLLGTADVLASDTTVPARMEAASPLGDAQTLAQHSRATWAGLDGPLGIPASQALAVAERPIIAARHRGDVQV